MFERKNDSRVILIYLAIKYEGDFDKILSALHMKEDLEISYEKALKVCNSLKCHVVTALDYDYPKRLIHTYRAPFVLFYYGDITLLDKRAIAVVGSREYSDYGKMCTEKIVRDLSKEMVIVSGLAKGIDAIAHETAIKNGGRTIAVLGNGIDICYPAENRELYEEIKKHHLLISEYPFKVMPDKVHFPMRNRIVVGLSEGVYVPQINTEMSGTMISISIGMDQQKPIYVAPFPPGSETMNNKLLIEGADFADTAEQMMEEMDRLNKR